MKRPVKPLFGTPLEGLEALVQKVAEASALAQLVRKELPDPLPGHIVTAARRGEDLVVVVDSAAWAARVRYSGPRLKARLEELGEPVTGKVRVRVRGREKQGQ